MTISNGNIFHVTGLLCGEFTGHLWIPHTRASDVELWFFYLICLYQQLNKQWRRRWLETQLRPLWRHCNASKYSTHVLFHYHGSTWQSHKVIKKVQASGLCFQCSGWQCKSQALKAINPIYTPAFFAWQHIAAAKMLNPVTLRTYRSTKSSSLINREYEGEVRDCL